MVASVTLKYDKPEAEMLRVIIFECRTNDRASSALSYDQPLA